VTKAGTASCVGWWNANGGLTVGDGVSSDLCSSTYKLYVNGASYFNAGSTFNGTVQAGAFNCYVTDNDATVSLETVTGHNCTIYLNDSNSRNVWQILRVATSNHFGIYHTLGSKYSMIINGYSNVTIGGSDVAANSYKFAVTDGDAYFSANGSYVGTWTDVSDRRAKKNISYFSEYPEFSASQSLMCVKPAVFDLIADLKTAKRRVGMIAQDILETPFYNLVVPSHEYLTLNYIEFVPYLIKANQEHTIELKAKDAIIKSLEERLAKVEALLETLVEVQ
jgi:hypothetical protein